MFCTAATSVLAEITNVCHPHPPAVRRSVHDVVLCDFNVVNNHCRQTVSIRHPVLRAIVGDIHSDVRSDKNDIRIFFIHRYRIDCTFGSFVSGGLARAGRPRCPGIRRFEKSASHVKRTSCRRKAMFPSTGSTADITKTIVSEGCLSHYPRWESSRKPVFRAEYFRAGARAGIDIIRIGLAESIS